MKSSAHGTHSNARHRAARTLADLKRLSRVKQIAHPQAEQLGSEMIGFFKNAVQKRQTSLGKIAERWAVLVPEALCAHCSLESFHRGTLLVLVDTASHLYEMKQLLLAGLQDQLLLACKSAGLRKISLKSGRWYDASNETRKPMF